ncbi:phosphatase PAP2 family protein [Streptomyces sp. NPDC002619]|uniref:phosphatase PAP2 family protein n=1 Tax=Streptomyces sp. NPDC002619 TaxID=3364655 RepID=UPI0036AD7577
MANPASFARHLLPHPSRTSGGRELPRWWVELLLVGLLYAVYETTRGLQRSWTATADRNGRSIQRWEEALHLAPEQSLNEVLHDLPVLAVLAAYFYATLHFILTPAVLIWLYRAHPGHYRRARTWLAAVTLSALIGFWRFPATPPRLLPHTGIHDTVADVEQWGWWSGQTSAPHGLGGLVNEYAAMPSLHVGWAVWSGWLLFRHARRKSLMVFGLAYPVLTTVVVVATGNHYLADAIAGAFLIVLFGALVGRIHNIGRHGVGRRAEPGSGHERRPDRCPFPVKLPKSSLETSLRWLTMIYSVPPPPPDDVDRPDLGPQPPDSGDGNGYRGASSWLRCRRRGQISSHLPLHLVDAFLVSHDNEEPAGGLLRFRISDASEAGRSRRSWWRRADLGHQLAGSDGELRLVRTYPDDETGTCQALSATLTLNGITDAVTLLRLNVVGPFSSIAGKESGHVVAVGIDVRFFAGLWDLAIAEHTRCQVHLEGQVRLVPDWPMPR